MLIYNLSSSIKNKLNLYSIIKSTLGKISSFDVVGFKFFYINLLAITSYRSIICSTLERSDIYTNIGSPDAIQPLIIGPMVYSYQTSAWTSVIMPLSHCRQRGEWRHPSSTSRQ